jgi:hypothetical protein
MYGKLVLQIPNDTHSDGVRAEMAALFRHRTKRHLYISLPQFFTGFSMKFERGQYGGVLDTTRQPPLDLSFCPHGVYLTLFQKTSVHALFYEGHNDHVPSPGAATLASLENSKIGSRFDKVSEQISRQTTFYSATRNNLRYVSPEGKCLGLPKELQLSSIPLLLIQLSETGLRLRLEISVHQNS